MTQYIPFAISVQKIYLLLSSQFYTSNVTVIAPDCSCALYSQNSEGSRRHHRYSLPGMHFVVAIFLVVVSWEVSSHICEPTCLFFADISFTFLLLGTFLITKRRRQIKQHGTIQRSCQRGRESHAAHEKTRKGKRTARAAETEDCRGLLPCVLN